MFFTKYLRLLKFNKTYIFYAFAYGLFSLVIPLGTQFLVNNLALAGIWANTLSFLVIFSTLIVIAMIFKHTQLILVEYLQRDIFVREIKKWRHLEDSHNSHYYFEIYTLLKSFSKTYPDLIDMLLISLFGFLTIIIFHPAFLVLPIVTGLVIYLIHRSFGPAYKTSIEESNVKYAIYDQLSGEKGPSAIKTYEYLLARSEHFRYVRKISFKMTALYAFGVIYVLAVGAFLIHSNQLSVGQLVAAELITTGIMTSLSKLPNSLESLYDFETSHYKIEKALRGELENH